MAKVLRTNGRVGPAPALSLKARRASCPGMGRPHAYRHGHRRRVRIYRGKLSVLTKIAQKITGAHWSGPSGCLNQAASVRISGGAMGKPDKTERRSAKKARCAIYTRKSSEEGLEQAFNSLDAQREACAAFILSQKHEGWMVLPTLYDDGGYSGGTMERPALKRLIADIEASEIDVVVVYKVDRLTRALSDFA
jgi:Resolvase, N terminal domain